VALLDLRAGHEAAAARGRRALVRVGAELVEARVEGGVRAAEGLGREGVGQVGQADQPAGLHGQAFLQSFLRRSSRLQELPSSAPSALAAGEGAF
jgi:hypothetical protein